MNDFQSVKEISLWQDRSLKKRFHGDTIRNYRLVRCAIAGVWRRSALYRCDQ